MNPADPMLSEFLEAYEKLPEKCFTSSLSEFDYSEVEQVLRFVRAAKHLAGLILDITTGDPRQLFEKLTQIQTKCSQSALLQKEAEIVGNLLDYL